VRFDNETIESLKAVARTKGIGYHLGFVQNKAGSIVSCKMN
jgi:hypothetical protein